MSKNKSRDIKNGKMIILNKDRDVSITPYLSKNKKKKITFLILPGGGYSNCEEAEGKPVAKELNKRGYNAFVLRYSVGKNFKWPYPVDDFDAGMQYIYDHAKEFNIDSNYIVSIGFSAGGHVASCSASIAKNKPFATVLLYGLTATETLRYCAPEAPDSSNLVNENTTPCFLAAARNDWIVPIFNTTRFVDALQKNYIDYECHIYSYGLHGFALGKKTGAMSSTHCDRIVNGNWLDDCLEWLEELSNGKYVSIHECCEYQDAHSKYLSSMNSLKVIFQNEEAKKIIKEKFKFHYLIYLLTNTFVSKSKPGYMDTISLKNICDLLRINKSIDKINEELVKIEIK